MAIVCCCIGNFGGTLFGQVGHPTASTLRREGIANRQPLVFSERSQLGACAMTTKFLDNKSFTFNILLS